MFDIEVFRDNPKIFYNFAKMVLPSTTKYSPTHAFLRLLQDKDKLLRVYTQNIDNLERLAGVEEGKLVQCHGSFATASCMRCKLQVSGEEIKEDVLRGEIPTCPACQAEKEQKERQKGNGKKRKRSNDWDEDDEDEDDEIIEGIMKVHLILSCSKFLARYYLLWRSIVEEIRLLITWSTWLTRNRGRTQLRSINLCRHVP